MSPSCRWLEISPSKFWSRSLRLLDPATVQQDRNARKMFRSMYAAGLVGVTGVAGVIMLAKKVSALGEARKLQRGPCCILEIGGCELVEAANQGFDWKDPFGGIISDGRPDLRVTWTHGSTSGETQTENNRYHAVWMSSLKIPFHQKEGFVFQVRLHTLITSMQPLATNQPLP